MKTMNKPGAIRYMIGIRKPNVKAIKSIPLKIVNNKIKTSLKINLGTIHK